MSDEWPPLTVLLVTWNRPETIRVVINALLRHLHYSGPLRWWIADDQSPDGYLDDLKRDYPQLDFGFSVTPRKGWGANVNKAMKQIETEYTFMCEDDYLALHAINLDQGVALLEANDDIGLVRYDGLAGHALNLELREAKTRLGDMNYLRILRKSPFLYVYSHRPHLKHKRFHAAYGPYRTGIPLGETEESFAKVVYNAKEGPDSAALADGIVLGFEHIGQSRQGSAADKESSGR